jgi:hypothetical protein
MHPCAQSLTGRFIVCSEVKRLIVKRIYWVAASFSLQTLIVHLASNYCMGKLTMVVVQVQGPPFICFSLTHSCLFLLTAFTITICFWTQIFHHPWMISIKHLKHLFFTLSYSSLCLEIHNNIFDWLFCLNEGCSKETTLV